MEGGRKDTKTYWHSRSFAGVPELGPAFSTGNPEGFESYARSKVKKCLSKSVLLLTDYRRVQDRLG